MKHENEALCAPHGIKGWCFKCEQAALIPWNGKLTDGAPTGGGSQRWGAQALMDEVVMALGDGPERLRELIDRAQNDGDGSIDAELWGLMNKATTALSEFAAWYEEAREHCRKRI